MGAARYTVFNTVFPDFARVADVARAIELKYGHDPERAEAVISEEMQELGAVKVNGVWHYNGEPVESSCSSGSRTSGGKSATTWHRSSKSRLCRRPPVQDSGRGVRHLDQQ